MGRRVLVHEWWNFWFRDRRITNGPTLAEFWGAPQDHQEIPLRILRSQKSPEAESYVSKTNSPRSML
nr:hypothetical protein [Romeria gracilis]